MTLSDLTQSRVDLFTTIHIALRKALFDVSVAAGSTHHDDPEALAALAAQWDPLVELLRSHTEHENEYIFPMLTGTPGASAVPGDEHRDLDDLLDDLDDRFGEVRAGSHRPAMLDWYRDLNRYVAATLEHLHVEETTVMPALWSARTDEELEQCRSAFLAATPPQVLHTTMTLFRAALPPATQRAMGLAP